MLMLLRRHCSKTTNNLEQKFKISKYECYNKFKINKFKISIHESTNSRCWIKEDFYNDFMYVEFLMMRLGVVVYDSGVVIR